MAALNMKPVSSRERTPLDDIGADVRDTLDGALAKHPGSRVEVGPFSYEKDRPGLSSNGNGSKEAADEWLHQCRSYAAQRPADMGGRFTFSGNTTKAGYVRFKVSSR
jgi:hypothetical protein